MGLTWRFFTAKKLQGDAKADPRAHFKQQAITRLVKSHSMYRSLFPFTIFFSFSVSTVSHPPSFPMLLPEMFVVMSFKVLSGRVFQTYSLLIAGDPQSVS